MRAKHLAGFVSLLILINACSAVYRFQSNNADVTISGTTYKGTKVYADLDQNAQQFIYTFTANTITETEMYTTHSRYQICSANSCNAYYIPYNIPKYDLSGLSVTTAGKSLKTPSGSTITTNYYTYNDGAFKVELWVQPNVSPSVVIQVRQSGSGFDRTIFFNDYTSFVRDYVALSAPSESAYPGCASKIQCGSAMDVVLVIDTSGSITPSDYVKEQNYVKSVVTSFDVGVYGVHIGFITFSTAANIRLNLTYNEPLLLSTIDSTIQDKGETNIAGGIYAGIDVFNWGSRSNVPKVMIFLTDGAANLPGTPINAANEMVAAANLAKGSSNNILIYAIGVGPQADPNQLSLIASGPSYISTVSDFQALSSTLASILQTVCVGGDSNACSSSCTNTEFCGCGSCVCAASSSVCGTRGTLNVNTCGCTCTGNWNNDATHKDCSICNLKCSNGATLDTANCQCVCTNSWTGNTCSECPVTCNDHQTNQTNCLGCACKNFWGGTNCQTCQNNCGNGGTVTDLTSCSGCTCPVGTHYTSDSNCYYCNPSYCNNHGNPTSDCKSCNCFNKWTSADCSTCGLTCSNGGTADNACSQCQCTGFYDPATKCASCISGYCGSHGTPSNDCQTCTCTAPWTGPQCNVCDFKCQNGGAVNPNSGCTSCTCVGFFTGSKCETCDQSACGPNGKVTDLTSCNSCTCDPGFTSSANGKCDICVSDICHGRGTVVDPNTCANCNCNLHATGTFCETCNESDCKNGAEINSDCSQCACKKHWSGADCDVCTGTDYGVITGVCLPDSNGVGSLADSCYDLKVSSSVVGSVCYNFDYAQNLIYSVTMINGNQFNRIQNSILTTAPVTLPLSTYDQTQSYTNGVSASGTNTKKTMVAGSTYYVVTAVRLTSNARAYASQNSNSYNTFVVSTCQDCLCTLDCDGHGKPNAGCTSCVCDSTQSWTSDPTATGDSNAPFCSICDENNRDYCSKHGHLTKIADTCNSCTCDANFKGSNCNQCDVPPCQNGGTTSYPDCGTCICSSPWSGSDCSTCDDSLLCNGKGTAVVGSGCTKCTCNSPWQGDTCTECSLTCNGRGTGNSDCTACVCDAPWTGADCSICSDALLCQHSGKAVDPATCNACQCDAPWSGNNCQLCAFDCHSNGVPANPATCNSCTCNGAFTVSSNCLVCDTTTNCTFCNKHGQVSNGDSACDTCTCYDYWGGDHCEKCTLDCATGTFNQDCTFCQCPGFFTPESNCRTCPLVCNNGGAPDAGCTKCDCINGWDGSDCTVCNPALSPCSHGTLETSSCSCTCPDQWEGRLCDKCTDDPLVCNALNNGGILREDYFGQPVCECVCVGFWSGTDCDQCLLNPLYGDSKCNNIQEPVLGDCTCHCPQYYVDDESCETCIIKPSDCVHPAVDGYVNLDPTVCSCGECLGNYSGRNCSICSITSCPIGYAFNETDCTCYPVCGNGIISVEAGEQCEISLMDTQDQSCCTNCLFNTAGCDDSNSCTFDDICSLGNCQGLDSISFNIDQDRMPLSPGPVPSDIWSRWGLYVSSVLTTPVLFDTTTSTRTNLQFPNSNPRGGSNTFGLVLAQQLTTGGGSICLNMVNPMEISLVSLLGVHSLGTQVTFYCADPSRTTYSVNAKLWTANGGPGGVEYIPVPCGSFGVLRVCYNNLLDAAIGPLYTCDTTKLPLGTIGDYVWSDFNRDNVQDSIEVGIASARVVLYDDKLNTIDTDITDANGKYLFTNLYAGKYIVEFQVSEGWTFSTPVTLPGAATFIGRTSTFTLAEGQTDLTRDAGLYFSGKIGDYVWYDVNQDGIQSGSNEVGVSGVVVNLYYSTDKTTVIKTTTTDANGFYSFNDLYILKTATTFYSYTVEVVPPPKSLITAPFKGSSTLLDSNFDQVSHFSNDVTLYPNLSERTDLTVDCGIYYCCGSIGDYVWYDVDKNGLQGGVGETGVPNVDVTLYWNSQPYDSQKTDSNGNYLFTGLPLYGTYKVYFTLPSTNYIFTLQDSGDDTKDSDASASGVTGDIFLTKDVPDVLTVDAGIISGCQQDSDCGASTDLCSSPKCENFVCNYYNTKTCSPSTDPCLFSKCNPLTGSCDLLPTGNSCNDGNLCTDNDKCTINGCVGTPNSKPCDDGVACTTNDVCSAGVCKGTTPKTCTASTNPCRYTECQGNLGCIENNYPDNTPCEDGSQCTVGDVCVSGDCKSGPSVVCALSDPCRSISCSDLTGICVVKINTGSSCDDKNLCTQNDVCAADGTCSGVQITCSQTGLTQCQSSTCDPSSGICRTKFLQKACDDKNLCTENDACDPISQQCKGIPKTCSATPCNKVNCDLITGNCNYVADNTQSCTDNDPCTLDKCVSGKCVSTPISCDDKNPCTTDQCVGGQCVNHNNFNPCDDKDSCTHSDSCFNGLCEGIPLNCDDNEICTSDYCEAGKCKHAPATGNLVCEDNNFCTPSSFCVAGKCQGFDQVNCDDGNPCTDDVCDPVLGKCVNTYNTAPCEDGDACTNNGVCSNGSCQSQPINCLPVDNVCLVGECINGVCHYQPNPAVVTCDDSNSCTLDDTCTSGACIGTPIVCSPIDECHDTQCTNGECVQVPNTASCDDGNSCTTNDKCSNGVCQGDSVVCNDNNPCTDDACNVAGFCVYTYNNNQCDDGNGCTLGDVCSLGKCTSGSQQVICDDFNSCTSEYCDTKTGQCVFSNIDGVCNDLNGCTENDKCVRGACVGTPMQCTGSNTCYDYFCNTETGTCDQKPNTNICDDNNLCTSFSSCVQGECVGVPVQCPSSTDCTKYACNPSSGLCVSDKLNSGTCSDNNSCTTNDVCVNGECKGTLQQCNLQCSLDTECTPSDSCHTAKCVVGQCVSVPKTCAATGNPCTQNSCDLATGQCKVTNVAGSCNDGDACTQTDICRNGVCVGLNSKTCSTTQKCRLSQCNSATGSCDLIPIIDGITLCNDNLLCTVNDVCTENGCVGTPLICNDGNLCTSDSCDSTTGQCKYVPNIETCTDGDPCTIGDFCSNSECVPGKVLNCDDSNVCTTDSCLNGVCSHVKLTNTPCSDNNKCSSDDQCFNGECVGVETLFCDDSNPCTIDSCDPLSGCVHTPSTGNNCDDGNICTSNDVCTEGTCNGSANCPPADAVIDQCVTYSCSPDKGGCIQTFATGKSCTVSKPCFQTTGTCSSSGVCVSNPVVCDDQNACSVDSCDPVSGSCVFVNNNVTCTPIIPNACYTYACVDKQCKPVTPKDCNDNNPCTQDTCENGVCKNTIINGGSCDDGNLCTEKDTCNSNGVCAGTAINCNDNNECTTDTCVSGICQNSPNSNTCSSSNKCALSSVCINRVCTPTQFKTCTAKSCNNAQCNSISGECEYIPDDTKTCGDEDNNKCTTNFCKAGVCANTPVKCDPATSPCVETFCNPDNGACGLRSNDSLTCSDGNSCTTDKCSAGQCVATPIICSDDNPCTYAGTCDITQGTCSSVGYSCHISPCLYYSCVGDGRCQLDGVAPNYKPILYLSVSTTSNQVTTNQLMALSLVQTNTALFTVPVGTGNKITSMDIDPNTGLIFAVNQNKTNQLVMISKSTASTITNPLTLTVLNNNLPQNLDISLRPRFVDIVSPYAQEIYAFEPVSDTFNIYTEAGVKDSHTPSGPTDATLISWDHYGRTAFFIKKGSKLLYVWKDSIVAPVCSNVNFGSGVIVSIDTAVDGTIFVGTTGPIAVYAVTFTVGTTNGLVCPFSKLTLPASLTPTLFGAAPTLLSLTVDNTYCPLLGASPSATPSITPSPSPSPVVVIPPPTTGSVAQPGGNLGGASGGGGVSSGQDTNLPLTGTSGYISTAVVGSIAGVAVLFAAIFGAVIGLNTSKEDKAIPLASALDTVDVSSVAVNNPTFQPVHNVMSSAL